MWSLVLGIIDKILGIFRKSPEEKAENRINERKRSQRKKNEQRRKAMDELKRGSTSAVESVLDAIFSKRG